MLVDFSKGYKKVEPLIFKLPNGKDVECSMPSVAEIKKISEMDMSDMNNTIDILLFVLNKNKSGAKFSKADVEKWDIDIIIGICESWADWIATMRKN